ncbi:MAG: hypothetical protein ABJN22_08180 [Litorimonas sp.]
MKASRLAKLGLAVAALALAGCETTAQYTSGQDYLARYQTSESPIDLSSSGTDADVRSIAAVEPDLRFPARIGLARIGQYKKLTSVPMEEAESWRDAAEDLGPSFGEFIPVSPLVANSVSSFDQRKNTTVIDHIRRGAARQHLDYVIAYEVSDLAKSDGNALRLADLTVLGLFVLPSRNLNAEATASAILLDVRNGYPYLTGSTFADKKGISTVIGKGDRKDKLRNAARQIAVTQIAEEFADGLKDLKLVSDGIQIAEARADMTN